MRRLNDCRVAICSHTLRQVLVEARLPGRRTGAIMIVDPDGRLRGIFTDSDLAKLFESRRDSQLDDPIRNVMTKNPASVPHGSMMFDAVAIMAERRISELPVIDADQRPVGMLDITDIVAQYPEGASASASQTASSAGVPRPKNQALLQSPHGERSNGA